MRIAAPGASAIISITVEHADTAVFGFTDRASRNAAAQPAPAGAQAADGLPLAAASGVIHPVYGTAAMVRDMEHAARLVLLPLLEPGEEGVGAEVWCRHEAPVAVGATVTLVATVASQSARRLDCEVTVRVGAEVVGRGRVVQALVDPDRFLERVRRGDVPDGSGPGGIGPGGSGSDSAPTRGRSAQPARPADLQGRKEAP